MVSRISTLPPVARLVRVRASRANCPARLTSSLPRLISRGASIRKRVLSSASSVKAANKKSSSPGWVDPQTQIVRSSSIARADRSIPLPAPFSVAISYFRLPRVITFSGSIPRPIILSASLVVCMERRAKQLNMGLKKNRNRL